LETFSHNLHDLLFLIATISITIIEFVGLFIIIYGIINELYNIVFKFKFNFLKAHDDTKLNSTLSTALEVLLAAEILKTITVTDYRNLVIIAVLIVLRIAMTLLLVWETDHKEEHGLHAEERHKKQSE